MRTWTTHKLVAADPAVVLELTDTDACRRWAPVPFELDGPAAGRLQAGTRVRVSGSLVGRRAALLQAGALGAAVDRIAASAAVH